MNKIKHLLPDTNYYKANLHTHSSTVSDGSWTTEEIKEKYMEQGYSIIAYTDHEVCVDQSHLSDENFLALTSYELSIEENLKHRSFYAKKYHLNLYSKEPHNTKQVYFDPDYIFWEHTRKLSKNVICDNPCTREYSVKQVNEIIKAADKAGFLVCLNHPVWSLQDYRDYAELEGLWGIEIINGGCCVGGYEEWQPHAFQELLVSGKQVFPIAADDTHSEKDAFIGFTMIGADELTYPAVIKALENGDFYASNGPLIHSLTVENGIAKIKTDDCVQSRFITEFYARNPNVEKIGEIVNSAEVDLRFWYDYCDEEHYDKAFFRFSITDAAGKSAYTRAYTRKEIEEYM